MTVEKQEDRLISDFMSAPGGDVFRLIEDLGIEFARDASLGDVSGMIECKDGQFKISVNAYESSRRQKFTAAHEIGHYMMHRDMLCENGEMRRHTDRLYAGPQANEVSPFGEREEVEANKYAARLLMPANLVRSKFTANGGNVSNTAQEFGVSVAAMKIRLANLGLRKLD